MKIIFDIQKFGGGGGSTTQTYTPSEYELEMQNTASQYSKDVAPNARWLNKILSALHKSILRN